MIYAVTQFVYFDVDKERDRIHKVFTGTQQLRQLHIFQLFLDGKYKECYGAIAKLPYDEVKECDEAEYVSSFIFDSVRNIMENSNIRIEKVTTDDANTTSSSKG